jgi:hypothetical protein
MVDFRHMRDTPVQNGTHARRDVTIVAKAIAKRYASYEGRPFAAVAEVIAWRMP